ncbi:MAG: heparinase II/III family protein [bacterium]|nr:heparinase II/III family protein [bacterium]
MKNRLRLIALGSYELDEIDNYYTRYHEDVIPHMTYTDFSEFKKNGLRVGYEEQYFNRRRRLNSTFMMYIAYGSRYLAELCDLIWAVCDEFTWALPAHTDANNDAYRCIDLFNAETAMSLTEIAFLLGDVLPDDIKERIRCEVNRRVVEPFENGSFAWETMRHNWAAVCGSCIGMIYLYNDKPVPERIFSALNSYLSGFANDGVCLEGLGYWSYGFGYFMYFAMLLLEKTGRDITSDDKILAIARFQQNMYFGTEAISCSDSSPDTAPLTGLTGLLCEHFKGKVSAPRVMPVRNDECGRWAHYIRSFIYTPIMSENAKPEASCPDSQWYIRHTGSYGVFIKGGCNAEPHNHNDVGSFILADKFGQVLCDIGCGEYTADYFDESKRYGYLCNSSFGHSVPIIDGNGQLPGSERRCTEFNCSDNYVELHFGNAYDSEVDIKRELYLFRDRLALSDSFLFSDGSRHSITERFISRIRPKLKDGVIQIGSFRTNIPGSISSQTIKGHGGEDITVYFIDFEVKNSSFKVEFRL